MGFNRPRDPGAGGDNFDAAELNGRLLLVYPSGTTQVTTKQWGEKEALRADVVVLDGTQANTKLQDVLIFGGVLIGQLKGYIGDPDPALGRLEQGIPTKGNPPWQLADFTDADAALATRYIEGHRAPLNKPAPVQQQAAAPAGPTPEEIAAKAIADAQAAAAAAAPPPPAVDEGTVAAVKAMVKGGVADAVIRASFPAVPETLLAAIRNAP